MGQQERPPAAKPQATEPPAGKPQKLSLGGFWGAVAVAGGLAITFGVLSWNYEGAAGLLICLGALTKVVSQVLGAAAKGKDLEGLKAEIEERLGYFDALAALTAFPALFAVGAEALNESLKCLH